MTDQSFLPEDYLERRLQRRTNVISLSLFGVVLVAVVAAFFVTNWQMVDVRRQQKQVNTDFEEAAKRLEQLETLQQRKQQMIHKAQVTASLLERVPRSMVLAELVNNMPLPLSLTEFDLETRVLRFQRPGGASALDEAKRKALPGRMGLRGNETEVPQTEVTLHLLGQAPTDAEVAQFMTALERSPMFLEVNLAYSEQATVEGRSVRKFRVDLLLNQDIDLRKFKPTLARQKLKTNPMGQNVQFLPDGRVVNPAHTHPGGEPGTVSK